MKHMDIFIFKKKIKTSFILLPFEFVIIKNSYYSGFLNYFLRLYYCYSKRLKVVTNDSRIQPTADS